MRYQNVMKELPQFLIVRGRLVSLDRHEQRRVGMRLMVKEFSENRNHSPKCTVRGRHEYSPPEETDGSRSKAWRTAPQARLGARSSVPLRILWNAPSFSDPSLAPRAQSGTARPRATSWACREVVPSGVELLRCERLSPYEPLMLERVDVKTPIFRHRRVRYSKHLMDVRGNLRPDHISRRDMLRHWRPVPDDRQIDLSHRRQ